MVKKDNSWIGKPIAKNNPHNFFKTGKNTMPVNMFKDSDGDGVPNVFDCKPNNSKKQGLISAVIGAVRGVGTAGGVSAGWKAGMEKSTRFTRYYYNPKPEPRVRTQTQHTPQYVMPNPEVARVYQGTQQREMENPTGLQVLETIPATSKEKFYRRGDIVARKMEAGVRYVRQNTPFNPIKRNLTKADKKAGRSPIRFMYDIQRSRDEVRGNISPERRKQHIAIKRAVQQTFPIIPKGATTVIYEVQSKKGQMAGRGRPRGSVKYSSPISGEPIGVYEWRKQVSALQKQRKQEFRAQLEMEKLKRRLSSMPKYEQMEVPQEVQGSTPDYSQYEQMTEQMPQQYQPQYQQQYQPQPQYQPQAPQRPIATVFKSSGGSPYPPVNRQPLAQPKQTIPYGYVESVDAFTGRRFLKQLPPKERWSSGG